jgi:hypothetical protein
MHWVHTRQDQLCVYAHPEPNERGEIELFFFSHGLRYLDEKAWQRIDQLKSGDRLQLNRDDDNIHDRFALMVETEELIKVGYCPRYLNQDLRRVMDIAEVKLTVERANPEAPLQFRLLCKAVFMPPPGFELFASDAYKPLAGAAVAA